MKITDEGHRAFFKWLMTDDNYKEGEKVREYLDTEFCKHPEYFTSEQVVEDDIKDPVLKELHLHSYKKYSPNKIYFDYESGQVSVAKDYPNNHSLDVSLIPVYASF